MLSLHKRSNAGATYPAEAGPIGLIYRHDTIQRNRGAEAVFFILIPKDCGRHLVANTSGRFGRFKGGLRDHLAMHLMIPLPDFHLDRARVIAVVFDGVADTDDVRVCFAIQSWLPLRS